VFEVALFEWKLTPEYINSQWTEEKLQLMFEARTKRLQRTFSPPVERPPLRKSSNSEFFARHHIRVKEVKRG